MVVGLQETSVDYYFAGDYRDPKKDPRFNQPRVIDVNVETNPMSPFGDVKSGCIKLDTLMT
jgi:hypothetical protein